MVVRSSLHRTKYSRARPNAEKPTVRVPLPDALRVETTLPFDQAAHDLRGRVTALLEGLPALGALRNGRLEEFEMAPDAWRSKALQRQLTDAVLADAAFLDAYDSFVRDVAVPHARNPSGQSDSECQRRECARGPRRRDVDGPWTGRGDAAAATWIFRGCAITPARALARSACVLAERIARGLALWRRIRDGPHR